MGLSPWSRSKRNSTTGWRRSSPRQRWLSAHHTDYSARKDAIKRDLRMSDSLYQINALITESIAENIKKGREKVN